jgi:hypothetical protein
MSISEETKQFTYAGQASWADPATTNTCRECIFWSRPGERVSRTRWRTLGDQHELAPRSCQMARRFNHEISVPVPHDATACAHFEANPSPPPVWAKHARRDS